MIRINMVGGRCDNSSNFLSEIPVRSPTYFCNRVMPNYVSYSNGTAAHRLQCFVYLYAGSVARVCLSLLPNVSYAVESNGISRGDHMAAISS